MPPWETWSRTQRCVVACSCIFPDSWCTQLLTQLLAFIVSICLQASPYLSHPSNPASPAVSHGRVPSTSQLNLDVKMWTVAFNDLRMERQIGEGSFGRVFLAKWNETLVAVKILTSIGPIDDDVRFFRIPRVLYH